MTFKLNQLNVEIRKTKLLHLGVVQDNNGSFNNISYSLPASLGQNKENGTFRMAIL